MAKLYCLKMEKCEGKSALDIYQMSDEEKAQIIERHKDDAEEYEINDFFWALNCGEIDQETNYWFFINE